MQLRASTIAVARARAPASPWYSWMWMDPHKKKAYRQARIRAEKLAEGRISDQWGCEVGWRGEWASKKKRRSCVPWIGFATIVNTHSEDLYIFYFHLIKPVRPALNPPIDLDYPIAKNLPSFITFFILRHPSFCFRACIPRYIRSHSQ